MEKKYSSELKEILDRKIIKCAEDLELESGHTKVLIYAILKYRTKVLEEVLLYLNINVEDLIEEILSIETTELVVIDPKITKIQNSYHEIHINSLIINAERESKSMGHDEIRPEHIILACLKYKGENKNILAAKSLMQKYGVKLRDYSEALIWITSEDDGSSSKNTNKIKKNTQKIKSSNTDEESDSQEKLIKAEKNLISLGYISNMNNSSSLSSDVFIGREEEIDRAIRVLCRKKKGNLMIIGESGTGKTFLVKKIVEKIVNNSVPNKLIGKTFYQVYLDNIVAGTKFRGEFEKKIKDIVDFISVKNIESKSMPILFIDEIHTLVGAGAAEGALDASGIIKPKLSSGEIQCIGTTTIEEYRKRILPDASLSRRFTNIYIEEPDEEQTIEILKGIKHEYQDFHEVSISDEIITEIVNLSSRYIKNRFFPDKAIDILDEACVKTISSYHKKDRNFDLDEDGGVVVSQDIVGEIMTDFTKIPLNIMIGDEKKKLSFLSDRIKTVVIGQDDAIQRVVNAIHSSRAGFADPEKPIATFLFLGSTGQGKTLLAKTLSNEMFGTEKIIRLDMSEYMEKNSVTRLVGSPPGYVGYEEAGQLTEAVRNKPYSVILLDEIEKAHTSVFNLFLQVFDEGRLTDSTGRFIDFRNTVIIMTSNIGISGIKNEGKKIGFTNGDSIDYYPEIEKYLIKKVKDFFSPEFFNRIDDVVVFKKITKENIKEIFSIEIGKTRERIRSRGYKIVVSCAVKDFLIDQGFSDIYGARPLARLIKKLIEQPLATMVVNGDLTKGDTVYIGKCEDSDELTFKVKN